MSRVNNQKEKVYVTHHIQQQASDLASLIIEKDAYIYICGDGNSMAKDVHRALVNALQKWGVENLAQQDFDAEEYLSQMKLRNRYLLDIWS